MSNTHSTLLKLGYKFRPINRLSIECFIRNYAISNGVYTKEYSTKHGVIEVAMKLPQDPHIELPTVFVIDMPTIFHGRLVPHISHEGYLCYVEQMEADWDPNNIEQLYSDVDTQIKTTLDTAANSFDNKIEGSKELDNEFVSYWPSTEDLYSLNKLQRHSSYVSVLAKSIDKEQPNLNEYITFQINKKEKSFGNNKYLQSWLKQRDLELQRPDSPAINTHYVWVKPSSLSGIEWPPKNLQEVLSWLELVDVNARDHLVRCLSSVKAKRNIVLLDIENQGPISLYLEVDINRVLCQLNLRRTQRKKKRTPFKNVIEIIARKSFCTKFVKLSVIKADKSTLLSRNKKREFDLSSKNIALIGCGTIGGYLAELLVRNGAGLGKMNFDLYDRDILNPHNFSRHTLAAAKFGKHKASSLASSLRNSIHLANNIHGYDRNFTISEANLSKYDIVIDATGRPPVSKRLAFIARQISMKRPDIIHVFNDGNGRVAKVLVDINISCYGCMTIDKSVHQNRIDMRFKDLDMAEERKVSCGHSYTIYDAGVSQISAAMALEAVLNTLNKDIPWTYSEFVLDHRHRTGKRKILEPQKQCVVCNGS